MKKQPKITIITATYNLLKAKRKEMFAQNVESVQKQTYKNIEHIVIDGASTDGTVEMLEEYQKQGLIKYYSEPDKGIYDAMNKGIKKAKGKYVVCLNSDDYYCNDRAVELLVEKAERENADACCASARIIDEKDGTFLAHFPSEEHYNLIFGSMANHQTYIIKTDVMKELGFYDLEYKISADTAFLLKMLQAGKKVCSIEPEIVSFRTGGASSNTDAVASDVRKALFKNYGQYHGLTKQDCINLYGDTFCDIPLNEAIELGIKLENPMWVKEFFTCLYAHRNPFYDARTTANIKYKLFGFISFLKIKKGIKKTKIYFLGMPLFRMSCDEQKTVVSLVGIPVVKIKNSPKLKKYYIFGLPILKKVMKISRETMWRTPE